MATGFFPADVQFDFDDLSTVIDVLNDQARRQ